MFGPTPLGNSSATQLNSPVGHQSQVDFPTPGTSDAGLVAQPTLAQQVIAAKRMIAAADAAEARASAEGRGLADEELVKLGYVADEGGTWGLNIPMHILKILLAEYRSHDA